MAYPPDYQRQTSFRQAENAGQALDTARLDSELNDIAAITAQVNQFIKLLALPTGAAREQYTMAFQALAGTARFVATASQTQFDTLIPFVPLMDARRVFVWSNGLMLDTNLVTVSAYPASGVQCIRLTLPAQTASAVVLVGAFDSDAASRSERFTATNGQTAFVTTGVTYSATMTTANVEVYVAGLRQDPNTYTVSNHGSGKLQAVLATGVSGTPVVVVTVKDSATSILARLADTGSAANGATMVGLADTGGLYAAATVEAALAEIRTLHNQLLTNLGATARIMHRDGKLADGVTAEAATADLAMGGFKLTGLGAGSANTDAATVGQLTSALSGLTAMLGTFLPRDGSQPMSGDLDLAGHDLLNQGNLVGQYRLPLGMTFWYPGGGTPVGAAGEEFAACNGQALSRTTYSTLFAIIGTLYGGGDGVTTFNLPNAQGRTAVHIGTGPGGQAWSLNTLLGAETHTLTEAQMPAHTHTLPQYASPAGFSWPGKDGDGAVTAQSPTSSTGGGQPHNNLQPSIGLNLIMKIKG